MANLNRVLLIGRLTRDPELRYMPSGAAVAGFGLAVNRFWKGQDGSKQEETVFVDIECFSRTADLVHQYLSKGRQVFIEGHLRFDQWTSQDGQKRSKLKVVADNVQFLDPKGEGGPAAPAAGAPAHAEADFGAISDADESGRAPATLRAPPSEDIPPF